MVWGVEMGWGGNQWCRAVIVCGIAVCVCARVRVCVCVPVRKTSGVRHLCTCRMFARASVHVHMQVSAFVFVHTSQ